MGETSNKVFQAFINILILSMIIAGASNTIGNNIL